MKQYIELQKALEKQVDYYYNNGVELICDKAIPVSYLEKLPTIDFELDFPNTYGEWLEKVEEVDDDWGHLSFKCCKCSQCGFTQSLTTLTDGSICKTNYCPNCGAKMKNGDNNEKVY